MATQFTTGHGFLEEVCKILKLDKPVHSLTIRASVEEVVKVEAVFFATVDELSEIQETMKRHIYPQPSGGRLFCPECKALMNLVKVDSRKNYWRCLGCGNVEESDHPLAREHDAR